MESIRNLLTALPAPVALVLMMGGFVFYALGCIRLGYGAAVKGTVLDLIEQAEHEIQGTKRGAERKAQSSPLPKFHVVPLLPRRAGDLLVAEVGPLVVVHKGEVGLAAVQGHLLAAVGVEL